MTDIVLLENMSEVMKEKECIANLSDNELLETPRIYLELSVFREIFYLESYIFADDTY